MLRSLCEVLHFLPGSYSCKETNKLLCDRCSLSSELLICNNVCAAIWPHMMIFNHY